MSDEIKLTLNPVMEAEEAIEEANAAVQTAAEEQPAEEAIQEPQFTEAEQKTIDEFSNRIDITDSKIVSLLWRGSTTEYCSVFRRCAEKR